PELEALVIRLAREHRSWGYDRIVGALANLGYTISDQTVGNILKRHGIAPTPERRTTTTWKEFIRTHMEVLVATDFFTAEVWTLGGLVTYYVLRPLHDEHHGTKACNDANPCPTLQTGVRDIYLAAPLDAQARAQVQTGLLSRFQSHPLGPLHRDAMEVLARADRRQRDTGHSLYDRL